MQTKYEFCSRHIAFRYHLYWMMTIIANTLLIGLGDGDPYLLLESQEAAEGICKSIEHLSVFKPFGVMFVLTTAFTAFGISSTERRMWIVTVVRELFNQFPIITGPLVMQWGFNRFTAGLGELVYPLS